MTVDDFVALAIGGPVSLADMQAHCAKSGQSLADFCDVFALRVAERYLSGCMDYDCGDAAMNALFALTASEPFFAVTDRTVPETAFAIYKAFDEGEYSHDGDSSTDVPPEKYTRPRLLAIVDLQRAF